MDTGVEYVRQICKQKGIAISKLEKDLGFGNGYFNPRKLKRIPMEKAIAIAEYLGCTTEYLLGEKDSHIAVTLNDNEYHFLTQYRDADESTKEMVRRILLYQEKVPNIKEDHHE